MLASQSIAAFHEELAYAAKIRTRILSGCIDDAISLLDEHFPSVLQVDLEEVDQSQAEPFSPTTRSTVTPHTIEPAHLLLNLHILAFVESARTMPMQHHCTDCSSCQPRSAPTSPVAIHWRGTYGGQTCRGQPALLKKARLLFSEAKRLLRPADRIAYLGELARVSAIVSYTYPEETELAPYFTQARREAVADQIERALLDRELHTFHCLDIAQ